MSINEILTANGITKYRLAKLSGVPHATLNDICSGKTRIEKCSCETLYKLAKVLSVSMETLIEAAMAEQTGNFVSRFQVRESIPSAPLRSLRQNHDLIRKDLRKATH